MTEIQKTLKTLKDKKNLGRFYITVDSVEKYIDGFVLDISKEFILVREFIDFTPKSLIIIPLNKLTKIKQDRKQKSFTRILKLEKRVDNALVFDKITLKSFAEIFKAIKKKHKYVIVEDVFEGESNFCIGEIARVNKESVSIYYFDITGKVDITTTTTPFKDIANVEYDSDYLNTFIRHLK